MASGRGTGYHGEHAVDGSLAYSLDWAVREREARHVGAVPRRQEVVKEQPKVRSASRVRVRERQKVSLFSLLGVSTFLGMMVLVLISCIQLTVISAETVELKKELEVLETENIRLTARHEQMFDLTAVKEAAEAAGMGKPSSSQICYLDISGGDNAVIYQQEAPGFWTYLTGMMKTGIDSVVEYFS